MQEFEQEIQENVLEFLSDKQEHSVQEIKSYLHDIGVNEYTEGQFAGSLNTLMRNDLIKKVDRGIYSIKLRSEDMRKCFVISPIGDEGSEVRKQVSIGGDDSPLSEAILDRIKHDAYKINIVPTDPANYRSMREVYGLDPALSE